MIYEHKCYDCQHEWEESYSIHANPPTKCPSCGREGNVRRLISGAPAVRVTLSHREKKAQLAQDRKAMEHKFKTDENFRANVIGETKYEDQVTTTKTLSDNLKQL